MSTFSILTDTTLCTGCELCVAACKKEYNMGPDRLWRQKGAIDDLSATRHTTIIRRPGPRYVRRQCRHCLEPACVSACLVGALQQTPEGAVIYDGDRCMGCRYCMVACPYEIPRYDWDQAVPYIRKCSMCNHRTKDGDIPACVKACPEKASIFGSREEMLEVAGQRLRDNPNKYVQRIWGEREVGGTAVLYISDIPLDFLGSKPQLGEQSYPELTWASLSKVPPTILCVGGLMAGIYWIIGRRMKMQQLEAMAKVRATEQIADDAKKNEEGQA